MTQLPIDLPPTTDELLGFTTCGNITCGALFPKSDTIHGCMQIGVHTVQEHFCSLGCRDVWRARNVRPPIEQNVDRAQLRQLGTTAF